MNKRVLIGVVVLCGLLSITAVATYGVFVVSEHSTGDDFASDNVEYYGMEIDGTGESAVVQIPAAEAGSTTTIPLEDDETFGGTVDEPIEIYPQTDMHEIKVTLFDQDETDEVELRDDNGNLIDVQAISNQQATLVGQMEGGETYELVSINHELGEDRVETRVTEQPESEDLKVEYAGEGTRLVSFETIEVVEKKPQTAEYIGEHSEVSTTSGFVNIPKFQNVDATGAWERYDNDEWVEYESFAIESTGEYTTSFDDDGPWRVVINAVANTGETSWDLAINSEGIEDELSEPTIDLVAPDDGIEISDRDVELEVYIEDEDLDLDRGPHDVRFYGNGNLIDTKEIHDNGTVSTQWSDPVMGENTWYVEVEDDWENVETSDTWTFTTPSELEIRNESAPDNLVTTDAEVEVTFFGGQHVETRSTTDGTVDMEGLPLEEFTVQVEADGYHTRQSIIRSITDQQTVYALPEDADTVSTKFVLDDATGEFTGEQTRVFVQKPITRDGQTDYEVVVADEIGSGGYTTRLEQGQRYLIEVENVETGQTRNLGPYVASESETVTLDVGTLEFSFEDEDVGYRWHAEYVNVSDEETAIDFVFESTDAEIDELQWTITERGGDEEVIADEVELGTTFVNERYFVDDDDNITTYVVEWQTTIDDEEIEGSTIVGPDQVPVGIPGVPDNVLHVVTVLLIFLVAGLFSAANVHIGAIVVSLLSGVFWFVGMLPGGVSGILIALALFISVIHMAHTKASAGGVPR